MAVCLHTLTTKRGLSTERLCGRTQVTAFGGALLRSVWTTVWWWSATGRGCLLRRLVPHRKLAKTNPTFSQDIFLRSAAQGLVRTFFCLICMKRDKCQMQMLFRRRRSRERERASINIFQAVHVDRHAEWADGSGFLIPDLEYPHCCSNTILFCKKKCFDEKIVAVRY